MSAVLLAPAIASADGLTADVQPQAITGGTPAPLCQYPATVALRSGGAAFCSGSIVHSRVVLYAAHCLAAVYPEDIAFGEDASAPAATVGVDFCDMHPTYDGNDGTEGWDVAYCVLSADVGIKPVPPLMGCEKDALQPGATMTIVGYGATTANLGQQGWEDVAGVGLKRSALQELESFTAEALFLLGGGIGACPGDSGGPAMIQLDDGSWRVVGAGSRLHPDSPTGGPNDCGYGAIYSSFSHVMPWIEQGSGYDVTPCHDADGTWNPDARCTGFPLAPEDPGQSSGTWADGCAQTDLSGSGASCGPPMDDGGGADDGGGDESGGEVPDPESDGSGDGVPADDDGGVGDDDGGGESTGGPVDEDEPQDEEEDEEDEDVVDDPALPAGFGQQDGLVGDAAVSCSVGAARSAWGLLALALLGLASRRRRARGLGRSSRRGGGA